MRLISTEDFRDIYVKLYQRGLPFLFSKVSSKNERTKSSFNQIDIPAAYWSIIPKVRKRWNRMITNQEDLAYEEYLTQKWGQAIPGAKMLSIGSGVCSHELKLAALNPTWEVYCLDFSDKPLYEAAQEAKKRNLTNIHFICENIYSYQLPDNEYDIVFFHASLHHFKNMDLFMRRIRDTMKPSAILVINEYVGVRRMLYDKTQISAINEGLKLLDDKHKVIFKTQLKKERYYGSGWLRMIISDPSECVESDRILSVIHQLFDVVEEKGYGGNILMPLLKDLSHHFLENSEENERLLDSLFRKEDDYLRTHASDFVFGIYKKQK